MKRFIWARSLVTNRIYTSNAELVKRRYADSEIVVIPPLIALDYSYTHMTVNGAGCTAPGSGFSAGHCFGTPLEDKVGKKGSLYYYDEFKAMTEVTEDYYKLPYGRFTELVCWLLKIIGVPCREYVYDVVKVTESNKVEGKVIGVLSAAPAFLGRPGFFGDVSLGQEDPKNYIDKEVKGYSFNFNEKKFVEWNGVVVDYAIYKFMHGDVLVTGKGWVIVPKDQTFRFIPGMSGSPTFTL